VTTLVVGSHVFVAVVVVRLNVVVVGFVVVGLTEDVDCRVVGIGQSVVAVLLIPKNALTTRTDTVL